MFVLADPDAAVAYRSLEHVLSIAGESHVAGDVQPLVEAVLRSYRRALIAPQTREHRAAWAGFVRSAAVLHLTLDRLAGHHGDARWRQATLTLQQIALENADLLADPDAEAEAS